MTVAYLILAHHKPRQFAWLFDALYNRVDRFLVHVDRKSPSAVRDAIAEQVAARPNASLLPSRRLAWGGWSIAAVQLEALRWLLERDADWRWFVNLSGQDYPLRSAEAIRADLVAEPDRNRIEIAAIDSFPGPDRRHLRRRLQYRHHEMSGRVVETTVPAEPSPGVRIDWKGSAWCSLTRAFCAWIVADPVAHRCIGALRHAYIPDEFLMQTLAMNGPFAGTIAGDNRREIAWNGGPHPETLTMRHRERLLGSSAHFARKFDEDADAEILGVLAARIGASAPRERRPDP